MDKSTHKISGGEKMKLLYIGVDGLDGKYLESHLDDLPHFKKLSKTGRLGTCRSVIVDTPTPHTGPNWLSHFSGVHPDVHGITSGGFIHGEDTYDNLKVNTIFDVIGEKYSMWLFNLPMTWPAPEVNGYVISGFPSVPDERICNPRSLLDELPFDYKTDIIFSRRRRFIWRFDPDLPVNTVNLDVKKMGFFFKLYEKYPTDVVFMGFTLVDRLFHIGRWTVKDDPVYKIVDDILGRVLKFFDFENLIICSDHGFEGKEHDMNATYYTSNGEIAKTVIDVPHILLRMLDIEDTLGRVSNRESIELTEDEKAHLMEKLRALGYVS